MNLFYFIYLNIEYILLKIKIYCTGYDAYFIILKTDTFHCKICKSAGFIEAHLSYYSQNIAQNLTIKVMFLIESSKIMMITDRLCYITVTIWISYFNNQ